MLYLFCLGPSMANLGALRPVLDSCSLVGWCVGTLGSLGIVFDHQAPPTRPPSWSPARPQNEDERSGADHLGSGSPGERITWGAGNAKNHPLHFAPPSLEVGQATMTASRGRVSGA